MVCLLVIIMAISLPSIPIHELTKMYGERVLHYIIVETYMTVGKDTQSACGQTAVSIKFNTAYCVT